MEIFALTLKLFKNIFPWLPPVPHQPENKNLYV